MRVRSWAQVLLLVTPLIVVALLGTAFGRLVWVLRHPGRGVDRPLVALLLWLGVTAVYGYGLLLGGFFVKDYPEDVCGPGRLGGPQPTTTVALLPLSNVCHYASGRSEEQVPGAVNPLLLVGAAALATMAVTGRQRPRT